MAELILLSLVGISIKHFIADYLLQKNSLFFGKVLFGHPEGILHVLIHNLLTLLWFCFLFQYFPVINLVRVMDMIVVEFVLHYFIDWAKNKYSHDWDLPNRNPVFFWRLSGFDQMLHYLTYLLMLYGIFLY